MLNQQFNSELIQFNSELIAGYYCSTKKHFLLTSSLPCQCRCTVRWRWGERWSERTNTINRSDFPWSSKKRKNRTVQSDYLVLGQKGAGAGAHLAHEAFPGVVIRHHRLLHAAFRLNPTERKSKRLCNPRHHEKPQRRLQKRRFANPWVGGRGTQPTRLMRWSHSVSDRKPL